MKKPLLSIAILIFCAAFCLAQKAPKQDTNASVEGSQQTSISKNDKQLTLESGTRLAGQLQTALDARKLKEGDPVILKTTQDIKSNGEIIFKKGSRLTGHVTEAQKKSKANKESKIGLVFDKLENASLLMPLNATLTSITQAATSASLGSDELFAANGSASSSGSASARSPGSGGLLGGVTNTVGSVVNSTAQTVDGVVNSTTHTVGNTTGAVGQTLKGLQIAQATNANAAGGSTLSLRGDNLKLEQGTVFHLQLNQASKAEAKPNLKEAKAAKKENQ
jgi:hypothetical protein